MRTCEHSASFLLHATLLIIPSKRMFETLGFVEEVYENDFALRPPSTDINTSEGQLNRRKLLRAWIEVSAWVVDFKRVFGIIALMLYSNTTHNGFDSFTFQASGAEISCTLRPTCQRTGNVPDSNRSSS
jgi:hypothetical protein